MRGGHTQVVERVAAGVREMNGQLPHLTTQEGRGELAERHLEYTVGGRLGAPLWRGNSLKERWILSGSLEFGYSVDVVLCICFIEILLSNWQRKDGRKRALMY